MRQPVGGLPPRRSRRSSSCLLIINPDLENADMNHRHTHRMKFTKLLSMLGAAALCGLPAPIRGAAPPDNRAGRIPTAEEITAAVAAAAAGQQPEARPASAAPPETPPTEQEPLYLGPLPPGQEAALQHEAYTLDLEDCSLCHENADPKNPGKISGPINEGCFGCHDDIQEQLDKAFAHAPAMENCTLCHNPHESMQPALLVEEPQKLCLGCHEQMKATIAAAKVKHGAVDTGDKCMNCHDPHGSDVEHLLKALPFDLCIQCHSTDDVVDHQGKRLTNFKKLLEENEEWHAPVAAKDCSACHQPHGSEHFRLLVKEYPPRFYSPYDPKLYALCFECHSDQIIADPETTTQTQFRNGSKNLHYVHVHKTSRGRTCRACHEIHAAPQRHLIRDGVPYGSRGWILKLNYTRTETGGSCARTCHKERSYDYTLDESASKPADAPAQ
ncbi:MAG: cytochrome C [Verrucomicrobia bacterium]|nr:MAG: cytochrome C [Verrucomicrobiota bacterium]